VSVRQSIVVGQWLDPGNLSTPCDGALPPAPHLAPSIVKSMTKLHDRSDPVPAIPSETPTFWGQSASVSAFMISCQLAEVKLAEKHATVLCGGP
jgi:hypothetical protein